MQEYTLGFLFDNTLERVVLIEKTKPEWQKGKLNGVGGKVELGELPHMTMIREFKEETGMYVSWWTEYAELIGKDYVVYIFYSQGDVELIKQTTEEKPVIANIHQLAGCISNIKWLIPLAINIINGEDSVTYYKLYED